MNIKSRNHLPQFFVDKGFKVGAEIGVHRGFFTEKLCEVGLLIYGIDPWIPFWGQGRTQNKQEVQDDYYEDSKQRLSSFKNCTLIQKTSMDALEDFEDNSLDFVYIDGDHNFKHISEDIYEWTKKVRSGGIVSGHDYFNTIPEANNVLCHVKNVVDAYVKTFNRELYIYGDEKGEARERKLSWLFIK